MIFRDGNYFHMYIV